MGRLVIKPKPTAKRQGLPGGSGLSSMLARSANGTRRTSVATNKLVNTATLLRGRVYLFKDTVSGDDPPKSIEFKSGKPKVISKSVADELREKYENVRDGDGYMVAKPFFRVRYNVPPPPPDEDELPRYPRMRLRRAEDEEDERPRRRRLTAEEQEAEDYAEDREEEDRRGRARTLSEAANLTPRERPGRRAEYVEE